MPTIGEFSENENLQSFERDPVQNPEEQVQSFAKQMLLTRLFIGNFQEKRYVDSLQSYRDVIVVANEEIDLIRDLEVVRKRVHGFYGQDHWIGITGPGMIGAPVGHCLWVELPDEIFGTFWYKISKIRFRPNEVVLRLKVIRPVASISFADIPTLKQHSPSLTQRAANNEGDDNSTASALPRSINESLVATKTAVLNNLRLFFNTVITIQNTKEAVKFISVLLVAVVTGLIKFVEYLGDFTIKFMRESSVFLKAATPIILAFINLIGKIIGGFYLLILGMWRDRKGSPPVYQSPYMNRMNPMITNGANAYSYNTVYFKRQPLPAPPRNRYGRGVTITPLD